MRRCKDCAKWREHRGYCPIYATLKPQGEKMCDWMRKQTHNEYAKNWMREKAAKARAKDIKRTTKRSAAKKGARK